MGVSASCKVVQVIPVEHEDVYEQIKKFNEDTGEPYFKNGKWQGRKFFINGRTVKTEAEDVGDKVQGEVELITLDDDQVKLGFAVEMANTGDLMYCGYVNSWHVSDANIEWDEDLCAIAEKYGVEPALYLVSSVG